MFSRTDRYPRTGTQPIMNRNVLPVLPILPILPIPKPSRLIPEKKSKKNQRKPKSIFPFHTPMLAA